MQTALIRLLFVLCSFIDLPLSAASPTNETPVEFVVVIPSYNNAKWCIKNLESVVSQSYPYWSIIYLNDNSKDRTGEIVQAYITQNGLEDRIKLINNPKRIGAMANYYQGIMQVPSHKVVATLDGDDWLAHDRVLAKLADVYADTNVWVTHGNFTTEPFTAKSPCHAYPAKILKKNAIRRHDWQGCQLRTFYAKLFHMIRKKDLMWGNEFVPMTSDLAFMFPILEMAARNHIHFVKDVIYVVNTGNPISDIKKDNQLQLQIDEHIRSLRPYKPLKQLIF